MFTICTDDSHQLVPTLLHLAARYGLQEMVATLIDIAGAEVACRIKDIDGRTPLALAKKGRFNDIASLLQEFYNTVRI